MPRTAKQKRKQNEGQEGRVRRYYRGWMRLPKPQPPKATKSYNKDVHNQSTNERNANQNTSQIIEEMLVEPNSVEEIVEAELSENLSHAEPNRNCSESPSNSRSRSESPSESCSWGTSCSSRETSSVECSSLNTSFRSERSFSSLSQSFCSDHGQPMNNNDSSDNETGRRVKCGQRVDSLEDVVHPNIKTTKFEVLLMVMNFSFRHGLTDVARNDLCELINQILGTDAIPCENYWFKKVFGSITFSYHFYCSSCGCYITALSSGEKRSGTLTCPVPTCTTQCNLENLNAGHFFLTLPIGEQLQFLLENTLDVKEKLNYRWSERDPDVVSDVIDGSVYQTLCQHPNILSEKYNISIGYSAESQNGSVKKGRSAQARVRGGGGPVSGTGTASPLTHACALLTFFILPFWDSAEYPITFNTDGACVYKSSKNTLWPIHLRINEFPPNVRFNQNNNIVSGLWFGCKDPDMSLFLSPFVQELQGLYETGFNWTTQGETVNSKVILLQATLDSVAKPKVQQIHQFNGSWACGYCDHPGVVLQNITSNQAKYLMNRDVTLHENLSLNYTLTKYDPSSETHKTFCVKDRTDKGIRQDMTEAETLRANSNRLNLDDIHVKGLKGRSALFPLLYFDLVFGFACDYMHGSLLGCARTVTNLWFDKDSDFFVGERALALIERRLQTITPPSCISRRPRPLSERIHWKANEWRSWLLYYSVPCCARDLPTNYFKHHCLFSNAIFILLRNKIQREELTEAAKSIVRYVTEYQRIYGEPNMFYNVHLLLHLPQIVLMYGPLWCYSTFSFESANGCLIKLVKGTVGVVSQIANKYSVCRLMTQTLKLYTVSPKVTEFCEDLLYYRVASTSFKIGDVRVLGSAKHRKLKHDEVIAFQEAQLPVSQFSFERFVKGGVMYHARCYARRGKKSDDSAVQLESGTCGVVERIIILRHQPRDAVKILLRHIQVGSRHFTAAPGVKVNHLRQCLPVVFGSLSIHDTEEIACKLIFMRCNTDTYICTFPNMVEKD